MCRPKNITRERKDLKQLYDGCRESVLRGFKVIVQSFINMHTYTGNHMTINFVETAPLSPQSNCTHMPQGIAINHLNTPRSIPQASL